MGYKTYLQSSSRFSWSRAICICCAISDSLVFFRVAMRLSHDTSTPFPASHSLRTSIVISCEIPRQSFLMTAILSPFSSLRRKTPNVSNLSLTRRGSSISSSCGRVGRGPETGDREHHNLRKHTNYKHLLFKEGLVTAFFLDFFSFFPLPEAAHERKCTIKNSNLTDKLTASRRRG